MAAANFIHSSFCLFRFNLIIGIGDGDRALFLGGVPAGGAARGGVLAGVARASARDSLSVRQGKALTGTGRKGVGLGGGVTWTSESERGRGVTRAELKCVELTLGVKLISSSSRSGGQAIFSSNAAMLSLNDECQPGSHLRW